jgi:pre-mRNA-processing factor SLU7
LAKTKYQEDVHVGGHTSVWGSYWHLAFGWAFKCCMSFDKHSLCRGEDQKKESIKREYEYEFEQKQIKDNEIRLATL